VQLTHSGSNHIFDMCVAFTANCFLVGGDVPIDNETFLMTDFINLKIKSAQSFGCAHKSMICVRIFIGINVHTYMSIYIYTVFLKKNDNIYNLNVASCVLFRAPLHTKQWSVF
jgi:hypothetical protein